MCVDVFPMKLEHCSWPFLYRNEILFPLPTRLNTISTLCMSHARIIKKAYVINRWLIYSYYLCGRAVEKPSAPSASRGALYGGLRQGFSKMVKSPLLRFAEQVVSPCSKLPRAYYTWLSHQHIPGERTNKPGQSTQTVIHLFGSRRCSCPLFLLSPSGISRGARVIWSQGRGKKSMTNDFAFSMKHSKQRTHIFVRPCYWLTSLFIFQRRLK